MVLRKAREDREYDKFGVDGNDLTAVRIIGSFSSAGLRKGGKIKHLELNDSDWTPLPLSPLLNRNAMSIQNNSGLEIKIEYDNSVVGYMGVILSPGSERFYDITDTIVIYAKSSLGAATVTVEELS